MLSGPPLARSFAVAFRLVCMSFSSWCDASLSSQLDFSVACGRLNPNESMDEKQECGSKAFLGEAW